MSDGPHRSLPMRRTWRKVAELGDKPAYTVEDVSTALTQALEQDCQRDLTPEFVRTARATLDQRDNWLFKDDIAQMEVLRTCARSGMDRAVLDNLCVISETDARGIDLLREAIGAAALDCAARGARQFEEHYFRHSTAPRAVNVRARLEDAIDCTDFQAIAARFLNIDPRDHGPKLVKQNGIDDGVELP